MKGKVNELSGDPRKPKVWFKTFILAARGETFSFKFLAYVGCLLTFVSSLGISAKDTGASNLGIRLNTASDSHPEAVFFDTLSWVQSKKVNCKWVGWYDCAAKYCPLHASWLKQAAAGANNDPAGTFARLYSECQAYEDRLVAQGVLRDGAMAVASLPSP